MGVSENSVPHFPNGFADHYPVFKWLFHWEYTLFSDKPMYLPITILLVYYDQNDLESPGTVESSHSSDVQDWPFGRSPATQVPWESP